MVICSRAFETHGREVLIESKVWTGRSFQTEQPEQSGRRGGVRLCDVTIPVDDRAKITGMICMLIGTESPSSYPVSTQNSSGDAAQDHEQENAIVIGRIPMTMASRSFKPMQRSN